LSEDVVSQYIQQAFVKEDEALQHVRNTMAEKGMPEIAVSMETGKLLYLLAKLSGAKHILEVGALGGYSGIWLARALPSDGTLTSLELSKEYADVAFANLDKANLGSQASYLIGPALDSFGSLKKEGKKFDFFFIDADKENYGNYLDAAIDCSNPGALITADNVLWHGRVVDQKNEEESTRHLRAFNEKVAQDPRVESMLVPIGDGLVVARVK
jgi:caffeoyl-CoA O-methyltransferase